MITFFSPNRTILIDMMKKIKYFSLIFISILTIYSCKTGGFSCSFDACATVAPVAEIQNVQDYLNNHTLFALQHCSGLFYRIENPGTGTPPNACSNIGITYNTYFFSGASLEQQTSPIGISLGSTIRAWRIAMPLIKAGGRIVFYVPPSLAYGAQDVRDQNGNIVIPANSYLVFEVNLVSVQ